MLVVGVSRQGVKAAVNNGSSATATCQPNRRTFAKPTDTFQSPHRILSPLPLALVTVAVVVLTLNRQGHIQSKMAPTKKSKSAKASESINARLQLVVKSGRYTLGYKQALKQLRNGKCK